ncbi:MAG: RNA-protein complex protein Nop10 [Methanomicrobium sp.]|nr:RNA-protein complex protein Nop10 [Methanomicrobium sp.]
MSRKIRCCPKDGRYTLSLTCPICAEPTVIAHPPRYSPQDRYGELRRKVKLSNAESLKSNL